MAGSSLFCNHGSWWYYCWRRGRTKNRRRLIVEPRVTVKMLWLRLLITWILFSTSCIQILNNSFFIVFCVWLRCSNIQIVILYSQLRTRYWNEFHSLRRLARYFMHENAGSRCSTFTLPNAFKTSTIIR